MSSGAYIYIHFGGYGTYIRSYYMNPYIDTHITLNCTWFDTYFSFYFIVFGAYITFLLDKIWNKIIVPAVMIYLIYFYLILLSS